MTDFRDTRYFGAFLERCEDLDRNLHDLDLTLVQLKGIIDTMTPEERTAASHWVWETYLDTPPFDRVFALLTPAA